MAFTRSGRRLMANASRVVYINARNLGNLDVAEPEWKQTSDEVMALDPTRATVVGGGNALGSKEGLGYGNYGLPTYGIHYFEVADREYPDAAYTLAPSLARSGTGEGGKVWPIDFEKLPVFMSETAFLPGRNAAQFAAVAGEKAFLGKGMNPDAFALLHERYATGYRWKEAGAYHFWVGPDMLPSDHDYDYWQPVAVLLRHWNRTFGPGVRVTRTLKLFNETRFDSPITVRWRYLMGDEEIESGERTFALAPGGDETFEIAFATPDVSETAETEFIVSAERDGETIYQTERRYRVLPESAIEAAAPAGIAVWGPGGIVQDRLAEQDVAFTEVRSLEDVGEEAKLVIVGPNAVTPELATDPVWMRLAASGKRVLVLEQEHPLHYQAVPLDAEPAEYDGRMSFSQNLKHPAFAGLTDFDLSFWNNDHVVYRNIYTKPSRGGQSLAHADDKLGYSTLIFAPINEGGLMLSQYAIGEKLDSNIVAQTLFDILVDYLLDYEFTVRPTALVAEANGPLAETMSDISLDYQTFDGPLQAIESPDIRLLVVQGTQPNLSQLADAAGAVETFFDRGGWIMVMGVTPESLEAFNELAGYDHLIRPFRMERIQFPAVRDPLTAGLTLRDVTMGSGERIQRWNRDEWPADDAFDYIVERPDGFEDRVKPMLNIGGLINYPRGEGGIILNQYRIAGNESNPVNEEKKKTAALPEAAIAWRGTSGRQDDQNVVAYQYQWNNPQPENPIESVTLRYADNGARHGAPVLLGLTAANVIE